MINGVAEVLAPARFLTCVLSYGRMGLGLVVGQTMKQKLERTLQAEITTFLEGRGWRVKPTHGDEYQAGFPDLWLWHPEHDYRWMDTKRKRGYRFTNAQLRDWYVEDLFGGLIWIMTDASEEEYAKLFEPPNWQSYLRPKDWERIAKLQQTKDQLLDEAYNSTHEEVKPAVKVTDTFFADGFEL